MPGLFIRWVKGLSRRSEVIGIARQLGISRREAACCCMEVWEWADDETVDGNISEAIPKDIDDLVGVPGLSLAMEKNGWLVVAKNGTGISFPRWSKHNGENAKKRDKERDKKRQQRELDKKRVSPKCPQNVPNEKGDKKGTPLYSLSLLSLPPLLDKEVFRKAFENWLGHKAEKKQPYKDRGLAAQISMAEKRAREHGLQAVIDAIERAIAGDWEGWDHESSFATGNGKPGARRDPRGNMATANEALQELFP